MGRVFAFFAFLLTALFLLGVYARSRDDVYNSDIEMAKIRAEEGLISPILPPTKDGFAIPVPSDPQATYRILKSKRMANGNLEVLSRRDGPSGTSFARREINCQSYTFRYLGEGDTLNEAKANDPNPGQMADLTGSSASSDVANAACSKVRK